MLLGLLNKTRRPFSTLSRRTISRPALEALEDRCVPSSGWAVSNGGSGTLSDFPVLSQPDAAGNLYVTGYFSGTATFGATTLNASSSNASYVAKLDPNGNFLWADQFGGLGTGGFLGIAVDGGGNVYLTGSFAGTQSFGSTTLTSTSASVTAGYICKVDGNGNFLWADRVASGTSGNQGLRVAVDGSGDAYFSWHAYPDPSHGDLAYLSKLDPSGRFLWTQQMLTSASGVYQIGGLVLDAGGNAYVSGEGNAQPTNQGWVVKYDPNGTALWTLGTPAVETALATYQDPVTGAISVYAGDWWGTIRKLDGALGSVLWADTARSQNQPTFTRALAVDGSGNVYAVGGFSLSTNFDPGSGTAELTPAGGDDVYLLKLDPSGNFVSVRRFGGTGDDVGSGLALDSSGNIYSAGHYQGTAAFDTGSQTVSLTSSGSTSLFVAKTTQDMGAIFGRVFNDLNGNGVFDPSNTNPETVLPNATVYLDTNNNGVLDPGEPTATTDANGGFEFNHLAAGSYVVRQLLASGWTQTAPSGNAGLTVNLAGGAFVDTLLLGEHTPTSTRHYANNTPVKTNGGNPNAVSTVNVSDAYTVFDLTLTVNVSNPKNKPLSIKLTGPDGTVVTFSTSASGTLTFETPAFNYKKVTGKWTLEVDGLAGGTLNSWALDILGSLT
jgi:hypothetical protein